ncbi:hypothetical protein BJX99DRAFT_257352 [Aspergillus californicus]
MPPLLSRRLSVEVSVVTAVGCGISEEVAVVAVVNMVLVALVELVELSKPVKPVKFVKLRDMEVVALAVGATTPLSVVIDGLVVEEADVASVAGAVLEITVVEDMVTSRHIPVVQGSTEQQPRKDPLLQTYQDVLVGHVVP